MSVYMQRSKCTQWSYDKVGDTKKKEIGLDGWLKKSGLPQFGMLD